MRRRDYIAACAAGIEDMGREEAAYWLGMAMHRKYPRRVLSALRIILVDPKAKN
jgi:disulfide oxidoreductase YuzD